jgi:predicted O-methyltransferase YrrM
MQILSFLIKYLQYLYRSTTSYGVHPPFLFDLVTKVFDDKSVKEDYLRVEKLKEQLIRDKRIIKVTDLGAGAISGKGKERSIRYIAGSSSKPKKYGRLLFRLVSHFQPRTVLELGTSLGFSSAYMALGYPSANVITVEGCPNIADLAQKNFQELNIHNIRLINGSFNNELPLILNSVKKIDFVFFDGNHQKEPTINYFEQCLIKADNETVIVLDDIHWSKGMEEAWEQIRKHSSVTLSVDVFFMGIVFLKKELTKQHFIIRF